MRNNQHITDLVRRAVKAGNKNPAIDQLKTLAVAVGDRQAYAALRQANWETRVMVKNAIILVNGEKPKSTTENQGNLFGQTKDTSAIASEGQEKIYTPKPVERTTEEQKDIEERKKVEDKHPETSDHKSDMPVRDKPLTEKIIDTFKKVLDRGRKATAAKSEDKPESKDHKEEPKTDTKDAPKTKSEDKPEPKPAKAPKAESKDDKVENQAEDKAEDKKETETKDKAKSVKEWATATAKPYAERIRKGEDPLKVLSELLVEVMEEAEEKDESKDKKEEKAEKKVEASTSSSNGTSGLVYVFSAINPGDQVTYTGQGGATSVVVEKLALDPMGQTTLVAKDPSGNSVTIPAGTPVQVQTPNTPMTPPAGATQMTQTTQMGQAGDQQTTTV